MNKLIIARETIPENHINQFVGSMACEDEDYADVVLANPKDVMREAGSRVDFPRVIILKDNTSTLHDKELGELTDSLQTQHRRRDSELSLPQRHWLYQYHPFNPQTGDPALFISKTPNTSTARALQLKDEIEVKTAGQITQSRSGSLGGLVIGTSVVWERSLDPLTHHDERTRIVRHFSETVIRSWIHFVEADEATLAELEAVRLPDDQLTASCQFEDYAREELDYKLARASIINARIG